MELFRKQAVETFLNSGEGKVLQIGRLPYRNFSFFIVIFLICLFAFLRWGRYSQTEIVTGVLIPAEGYTRIFSGVGGVLSTLHVAEGQSIQQHQLLVTLRSKHGLGTYTDFNEALIEQTNQTISLQKQRIDEQQQLHRRELEATRSDIDHTEQQIKLSEIQKHNQNSDIELLQNQLSIQEQLFLNSHISKAALDEKQRQLLASTLQSGVIDKDIAELQARLAQLQTQLERLPIQHQAEQLEARQYLANLTMQLIESNAQLEQQIQAPVGGNVSNIIYEQGDFIAPSRPIMTLLPNHAVLNAELYVPTRARGFLQTGQQVLLRFHAFPYQKFGVYPAKITDISATIIFPEEFPIQLPLNEPVYRIRASLDDQHVKAYGNDVQLQPGMLLDAEIVKDRRTLFEWLFEPVLSMSKRP